MTPKEFSLAAIVVPLLLPSAGCSKYSADDCWIRMQRSYHELSVLQQSRRLNEPKVHAKREELAGLLRICRPLAGSSSSLNDVFGGVRGYITLLDIAVVADDGEATASLLESGISPLGVHAQDGTHLYGANTLQLAASMESRRAVAALLQAGVDPNLSDASGFTALHLVGTQTPDGLNVIVDLVRSGADLDLRTRGGITPILLARTNGDLRKVECLLLLGATQPSPEEISKLLTDRTPESPQEAIDAVLLTGVVDKNSDVGRVCRKVK